MITAGGNPLLPFHQAGLLIVFTIGEFQNVDVDRSRVRNGKLVLNDEGYVLRLFIADGYFVRHHHLAIRPEKLLRRKVADLFPLDYNTGIPTQDRKSTRLNSSHVKISYAVFCLKKKNKEQK